MARYEKFPPPSSSLYLFRRLWTAYIRPYRSRLGVAIFFMTLSAASTAGLAKMMEPIIDDVFKAENVHMLHFISLVVLGLFIAKGIASYGESITMNYIGQRIISNLQGDLFHHLVHADLGYLHQTSTGALISRCTNDVSLMRGLVSNAITNLGKDFLTVICLISIMFYQDWLLSLLSLLVLPVAVLPIARFGKKMRKVSTSTQKETGSFLSLLKEIFQGARLVKAYNMESYEIGRARAAIEDLLKLSIKSNRIKSLTSPLMETLGGLAIVVVISYGGHQVITGHNTAGAFFSFISAFLLAYEPLKRLANLNAVLQEGLAATTRVFSVLDEEPAIKNGPKKLPQGKRWEIEFRGVFFHYLGSEETRTNVLKNINLKIAPNSLVAFVGPSGSGKSTLLNLIPRFYDPTQGVIQLGDHSLQDLTLHSLRQSIALVSQEITLFDDTIKANILYGDPSASEAQIMKAAKQAAAHDFILKLPQGYDTIIGESGLRLSGGQRQRLAIARAFLKNAPILLLDEATSSLDSESEKQVQEALNRLMRGRTCLVIAHRLSTVRNADTIFVMQEGSVVEKGTHDQLLAQKSLYAQLCRGQIIHDDVP